MSPDTVSIETIIHAPVEKVWDAWTQADLVLKWFGSDPDGSGIKAILDIRQGGNFEITFADADGTQHTCFGVYKEVVKPHRLSFTWTWKSEPATESFVSVKLMSANEFTRMIFEHARVGTGSAHNYIAGWKTTFEKLKWLFENSPFNN